jgi:hypothetical protein
MSMRSFNWGHGVGLVYTAFAIATIGFVTFAMGTPVDLVSDDYYALSLRQDARMEAERNAGTLRPAPAVVQAAGGAAVFSLSPEQAAGAAGTITLYRPSDAAADRTVALDLGADGRQQVALEGLAQGRWILQVRWSAAGREYYFEQPVIVR